VGIAARMRVSSATRPPSSGTFRSDLSSTRLPATSRSRTLRTRGLRDLVDQIDHPTRVSPLVVIPGDDLYQVAVRHRQAGVEDRAVRAADDVAGDDRIRGVLEDAGHRAPVRCGLERLVDLVACH